MGSFPETLIDPNVLEQNVYKILLSVYRQLSRHLVTLWVTGHPTAMGLLKRIMVSFCFMFGGPVVS